MRYVVHGHHLELLARDAQDAHDLYWSIKREARRKPYDRLLQEQARTVRITSEWRYLLARAWPLVLVALIVGAGLAL